MPTFNGERYIAYALESIVSEKDDGVEVVVVDDGSTDSTLDIVRSFADRLRLLLIQREHRGNWVQNTNAGMAACRGDHICWLHQDDAWSAGRLNAVRRALAAEPQSDAVMHSVWFIDDAGRRIGRWRAPLGRGRGLVPTRRLAERMLIQCCFATCATVLRRDFCIRLGPLNDGLWYSADWDYWLRAAARGRIYFEPQLLAAFRLHSLSQTVKSIWRIDECRTQFQSVLETHIRELAEPLEVPASVIAAARLAAEINASLAEALAGRVSLGKGCSLGVELLRLGPVGWFVYLRGSRIWERVLARIRAGAVGWRRIPQPALLRGQLAQELPP
jgi:glycosyltransferase involved in cell wall biosynthesis